MSALIDGLPDAVSIMCLARVPFYLHLKLELVSHSWRDAYRSGELYKARQEVNCCEELLCMCAFEPDNLWQLYDPLRNIWITLPIFPSTVRHLAHFGVVSVAGKLFVLGGGSDDVDPLTGDQSGSFSTDEVWSYDPVSRRWSLRAPMIVPRAMFACCVLDGKIIVAGGFTNCRKSISKAEIYDPEKDVWDPLPDLPFSHNAACSGVVVGGKVHVLQKGLSFSTVQILENIEEGWIVRDYSWPRGPTAVLRDELYVMHHGVIYKLERNLHRVIAAAYEFRKRIDCAVIGLGDDIYVIGGVLGPERLNRDIKLLSDIDVFTVGPEKSVWRKLSPMTKCKGTVLGCTTLKI